LGILTLGAKPDGAGHGESGRQFAHQLQGIGFGALDEFAQFRGVIEHPVFDLSIHPIFPVIGVPSGCFGAHGGREVPAILAGQVSQNDFDAIGQA
jgi:hypothetical protein